MDMNGCFTILETRFPPEARFGAAVSGGSDSVALLHLLAESFADTKSRFIVLHLNHGLRGAESDADEAFVRETAKSLGFAVYSDRRDVRREPGESLEMAARRERLAFFAAACREHNLYAVLTGHHAGDAAETLLLRLFRGAGMTGLSGLREESNVDGIRFIRPLLRIRPEALRDYLSARNIGWREDSSNRDETIPRNRIRHTILPFLTEQLGETLIGNLVRTADILAEEDRFLEELTAELQPQSSLLRQLELPLQRRILRRCFHLSFDECARVTAGGYRDGFQTTLSGGRLLRVRSGSLELAPEQLPEVRYTVTFSPAAEIVRDDPFVCTVPTAKAESLAIRTWHPGDRMTPIGFDGSKKLQDIWTDLKIAPEVRATIPVFAFPDGEIAWVPGYRISARLAAKPGDELTCIRVEETK